MCALPAYQRLQTNCELAPLGLTPEHIEPSVPATSDNLETVVEKAGQLVARTAEARQKYAGIGRSYKYYKDLSESWHFVEANSRALLNEIEQLFQQKVVFETEKAALFREFAHFDSKHHVTYSEKNTLSTSFQSRMNEVSKNIKFYEKLPALSKKIKNTMDQGGGFICCRIL